MKPFSNLTQAGQTRRLRQLVLSAPGQYDLARSSSPKIVSQLGMTMAKLHNHADTFAPSVVFTSKTLDHVWVHGEPTRVASNDPDDLFTTERRVLIG